MLSVSITLCRLLLYSAPSWKRIYSRCWSFLYFLWFPRFGRFVFLIPKQMSFSELMCLASKFIESELIDSIYLKKKNPTHTLTQTFTSQCLQNTLLVCHLSFIYLNHCCPEAFFWLLQSVSGLDTLTLYDSKRSGVKHNRHWCKCHPWGEEWLTRTHVHTQTQDLFHLCVHDVPLLSRQWRVSAV